MAIAESASDTSTALELDVESFLGFLSTHGGLRCSLNTAMAISDLEMGEEILGLLRDGLILITPADDFETLVCRMVE